MKPVLSSTAVAVTVLLLAGCGTDDTTGPAGADTTASSATTEPTVSAEDNGVDVAFATRTILHHRQAIRMASIAQTRSTNTEVKKLAQDIVRRQDAEIRTLSSWLLAWREQPPLSIPGLGEDSSDLPGSMMDADLSRLESLTGRAFDRAFLSMMIAHHNGAVEMARREQMKGNNRQAIMQAKRIESTQTAEITTMRRLLDGG